MSELNLSKLKKTAYYVGAMPTTGTAARRDARGALALAVTGALAAAAFIGAPDDLKQPISSYSHTVAAGQELPASVLNAALTSKSAPVLPLFLRPASVQKKPTNG